MRRYLGGDSDLEEEEENEGDQGSPMDISRGTATPQTGGRNVPWITDEQAFEMTGGGGLHKGQGSKPEWMTKSQEFSPPTEAAGPVAKKRLAFESMPGPGRAEDDEVTLPVPPASPPSMPVLPRLHAAAVPRTEGGPDLYDVDPWEDVDFARLAREQAEQADRLGRPRPSDKFMALETEHAGVAARLERILRNALSRQRPQQDDPVIVLYASTPELNQREGPLLLWRSSPGRSHALLHVAVQDYFSKTRFDGRIRADGVGSVSLTRLDLFRDSPGAANIQLRSTDEDTWVLEPGTFLPSERIVVILIQEDTTSDPQMLELQPLDRSKEPIGTTIDEQGIGDWMCSVDANGRATIREAGWRLEYEKTGGIAGVHQETIVHEDGTIKFWDGRKSRITPARARQLFDWAMHTPKAGPTPCCDFFSYHVTIRDARGKPILATKKVGPMPLEGLVEEELPVDKRVAPELAEKLKALAISP
jgi:hypothetical protein